MPHRAPLLKHVMHAQSRTQARILLLPRGQECMSVHSLIPFSPNVTRPSIRPHLPSKSFDWYGLICRFDSMTQSQGPSSCMPTLSEAWSTFITYAKRPLRAREEQINVINNVIYFIFFIFNEMHIDIYENIACAFQFITGVKAAVSSKKAAIQNTSFPSSGVICLYVGISGLVCAFAAPIWHLSECCCPFLSHVIGLVWLLVCTKVPGAPWSLSQQHSVCFENMALVFIFLGFISVLVSFISFGGSCGAFQCANVCLAQDVPFSLLGLACLFFLLIFIFNSQALKRDSDISKPGAYFNMSWCVLDSYSPKPLESVQ